MTTVDSNLLGEEQPVHSQEVFSGENVLVTPSKLIVEKDGQKGRAIMLSKLSMMRKRTLPGPDKLPRILSLSFIGVFFFFVGLFAVNSLTVNGVTSVLTIGLLSVSLVLFGLLTHGFRGLYAKDWSPPEGVVWLNIRSSDGGVGFKIEESEISKLVTAIDEHTEQEVTMTE